MNNENTQKNMAWNAAGNLIYLLCQWLLTVLVTRLGDFQDAGILSIAMSVSATFQTLAMFGIRNFQVSDIDAKYSASSYVKFRIITCALALVFCMLFSVISGYSSPVLLSVGLFMLYRLAENFSDVLHGIAQKAGRLDIAGKSFTAKGIGSLAVFLTVFILTKHLNFALVGIAVFSIAHTFLYDYVCARKLEGFNPFEKGIPCLELAKETLPLCVYLFLTSFIATLPKLILEQQRGEEILGIYSSIFAPALLVSAAAGYLYTPFITSFASAYAKKDTKAFVGLFVKIAAIIVVMALVVIFVAAFLGEFGLVLIFGEKIRPHSYLLIPILISVFTSAFFTFMCMIEVVMRDFLWLIISCVIGMAIEISFAGFFIRQFDANGASYIFIIASSLPAIILLARFLFATAKLKAPDKNP